MSANDIEEAGGMPAEVSPFSSVSPKRLLKQSLYLCCIFPRNHTCPYRRLYIEGRHAERFQGKCHYGSLDSNGTGLPAYRNLRIDTLGAEMEQLSPEEAAERIEGVALPEFNTEGSNEEAPSQRSPTPVEEGTETTDNPRSQSDQLVKPSSSRPRF